MVIELRNPKLARINLREIFDNRLLKMGYLYYKTGHLKELTKEDNRYFALTEDEDGTHQVMIDFLDDRINFSCDCPDLVNSPCKHIVACAYAVKDKEKIVPIEVELLNTSKSFKQYVKKIYQGIQNSMQAYQPFESFQDFFKQEVSLLEEELFDHEEETCQKVFYLFTILCQVNSDLLRDKLLENILSLNNLLKNLLVHHTDFIIETAKWYSEYPFAITLEDIFSLMSKKVSTYLEATKLMEILEWINQDKSLDNHETYLLAKIKLNDEYLDKEKAEMMIEKNKEKYISVLDYYINRMMREEKIDEVIMELESLKEEEHLAAEHAYLLLDLYMTKQDHAKFNDLAEFIFYQAPNFDCYNILKANLSKIKFKMKKDAYLEALFQQNVNDYYRVIYQEKDERRLYNFYLQGGLEMLNHHANEFDLEYQEEIINNNLSYIKANVLTCKSEMQAMDLMYYVFQIQDILGMPLAKNSKLLSKIKHLASKNECFKRVFQSCIEYLS